MVVEAKGITNFADDLSRLAHSLGRMGANIQSHATLSKQSRKTENEAEAERQSDGEETHAQQRSMTRR